VVSVPEIWKEVAVTESIIELKGLTRRYGQFTAVDSLNLAIEKGEIFGLLGPNGAGKSTTILMMLGLTEPDSGTVSVCGYDPVSDPVEVKRRVGYLPEEVGFYDDLTGMENLTYTARLNGFSANEARTRAAELIQRVGLAGEEGKKTGKYSRGMRQRLGLADVLIKDPEVIILDEPTLGIDPAGVREFLELIVRLSREQKITVLFSSHHLHQVQQVCDRVGIFVKGKLLAVGDVESLAAQLFNGDGRQSGSKKEYYSLDDIYFRYFEGGVHHE
jgi:ABC-2 type transport system ATP-binding protein